MGAGLWFALGAFEAIRDRCVWPPTLRSVSVTASATIGRPPESTSGGVTAGWVGVETGGAGGGDVRTGFGVGIGPTAGGGAITGPPPPAGGIEKTIVAALGPTLRVPSLTV